MTHRQDYLPPERTDSVQQQVATGSAWTGIGLAGTTAVQLVRSIIFARLLLPADFGVLSLATVFTQFILIFANFGFNASIIYQRDLDRRDLNTVWWSNFAVDGTVAIICCVAALISGQATGKWDVSWVVCLLAGQFVLTATGSVNVALMRRQFMFKEIAYSKIINAVATMLSALFCVAVLHWGVYGLVAGMIFGNLVTTLMYFWYLPWLPSFCYSRDRLRRHLSYGGWFLGVNVVTYINGNLDRTLVGTRLDTTQLGYYEYASNIPMTVATQLSFAINSVLFPAFSSLQDNLAEVGRLLKKIYRYNALITFPLLTGMAVVAHDFVFTLYGEKWAPVVPLLQVFCVAGMLRQVINPLHPLCNGLGMPRLPFKWALVLLPVNITALWIGIHYHGVMGAVEARMLVPIVSSLTLAREIFRHAEFRWRWLFQSLAPATICSVLMAAAVLGARQFGMVSDLPDIARLLVQVGIGGLVYVAAVALLFREDTRLLLRQGRRFIGRE